MNEEKQPHPVLRTTNMISGIMCGLFALFGIDSIIEGLETSRTFRLIIGIVALVFGGLGFALYLWMYFRHR